MWAMMIFFLFGLIFPAVRTRYVWLMAMAVTYGVEFSQLYQAEWINTIRHMPIVGLLLGYVFLWSDLLCYLCGITTGALIERNMQRKRSADELPAINAR